MSNNKLDKLDKARLRKPRNNITQAALNFQRGKEREVTKSFCFLPRRDMADEMEAIGKSQRSWQKLTEAGRISIWRCIIPLD